MLLSQKNGIYYLRLKSSSNFKKKKKLKRIMTWEWGWVSMCNNGCDKTIFFHVDCHIYKGYSLRQKQQPKKESRQ